MRRKGILAALAACAAMVVSASPASTQPDFYSPPSPLPASGPGSLIKTEGSPLLVSIPTAEGAFPAVATRIMYRSADTHGNPIAVTATYFEPGVPWRGNGPRPFVSMAPGTQGQGDQCAPSKLLSQLIYYTPPLDVRTEYELLFATAILAQGIPVVLTDYEGLGTPGVHTYVNRKAEAHAVLDAARAAKQLPSTTLSADSPVALWGYSQGGGAAAAAAELHASYAPELDLRGVYAGAPPADLAATLPRIDGTILTGAIGYALNGFVYAYPELRAELEANINDRGKQVLAAVANQCVGETALTFGFQQTSSFTKSGEPLAQVIDRIPAAQRVIAEQRIGSIAPKAPVLIQSGTADDLVPYGQARQLAREWCAKGATVQFSTNELPPILPGLAVNHALPYPLGIVESIDFISGRLAGALVTGNC
jgi:alpha-beta hydrolase superfamily lysophospholipase